MQRILGRFGRGAILSLVVVSAAVVVFVVLTVAGIGGHAGDETHHERPKAPRAMTAQQREVAILSQRESGSLTPDGQRLSEEAPVSASSIRHAITSFKAYAVHRLGVMQRDVAALRSALASGDRSASRERWETAFSDYVSLGAVYGAFGDYDAEIDGLAGGLPGGVADPHFSGLHRIEFGLWGRESPRSLVALAAKLSRDVRALRAAVPGMKVDTLDFTLRAHEILEDAQRDFLSGTDVPYSHEGVLATYAAVEATKAMLTALNPILSQQSAGGPSANTVATLEDTLLSVKRAHGGSFPANGELTRSERETVDARVGGALTQLQAVPGNLETIDQPVIPTIREQARAAARREAR